MSNKKSQKGKGSKKHGRNRSNKRPVNQNMSLYVRGKITFEQYQKNQ